MEGKGKVDRSSLVLCLERSKAMDGVVVGCCRAESLVCFWGEEDY